MRRQFRQSAATFGVLAVLLPLLGGGCTPTLPDPPAEGYVLVPRVFAARLEGGGSLDGIGRPSLQGLIVASRAATARQTTVEISGQLSDAEQITLIGEIRASLPYAVVTFRPSAESPPLATIRYIEIIPKRCLTPDPWVGEGYLPGGCASALSAVRSVGDPHDLIVGKPMGPAPVEGLAQGAIRYLDQGEAAGQPAAGQSAAGQTAPAGAH